jgi:hypothetical protein
VNPDICYENAVELATLTAYQFDERTDGPLARAVDRDPARMVRMADASSTWNTLIQVRFQAAANLDFLPNRVYIPAGHNLASCDSWRVLSGTSFGAMSARFTKASPAAGVIYETITGGLVSHLYWALEINDADRASSQVIYEVPEIFLTRETTPTIGVDPRFTHAVIRNVREDESESGLVRIVKRGANRRRLIYSWNRLEAGGGSDTETIETLLAADGSAVGFPMIPAGETVPIFARVSAFYGPVQDHPNPQIAEEYQVELTFTEVLG